MTLRIYAEGTDLQGDLRQIARYDINQYRCIEAKAPTYLIVVCERCEVMSLQRQRPIAKTPTKCGTKTGNRRCNGTNKVVEEVQ